MRNREKDEIEMAERRKTILLEGFRLFEANGIETTGMQEIATACNLGIATLYRYYKNKLDLTIYKYDGTVLKTKSIATK